MTMYVPVAAGNDQYRIAMFTNEGDKLYQFFQGYSFMGSVDWTDEADKAYIMDFDEAEQIISDLESADEDTSPQLLYLDKLYRIKPEYLAAWGSETNEETVLTGKEVLSLANEWEKPVDELLDQLIIADGMPNR